MGDEVPRKTHILVEYIKTGDKFLAVVGRNIDLSHRECNLTIFDFFGQLISYDIVRHYML